MTKGEKLTGQEVEEWTEKINNMTHLEMALYWKTAPCFPVFHLDYPLYRIFEKRFMDGFGGFTREIKKEMEKQFNISE